MFELLLLVAIATINCSPLESVNLVIDSAIRAVHAGVTTINLDGTGVTRMDLLRLMPELAGSQVFRLSLCRNSLRDIDIYDIAPYLVYMGELRELSLNNNLISDQGVEHLVQVLVRGRLQELDLADNRITGDGAKTIADHLLHLNNDCEYNGLSDLILDGNFIGDDGVKALASKMVSYNGAELLYLGLSSVGMTGVGLQHLTQGLIQSHLETLHISDNGIDDAGISYLAQILPYSELQELHIWKNQIGKEGALALAQAITFSNIKSLDISYNTLMGDEGLMALCQYDAMRNMEELSIVGINVTGAGITAFVGNLAAVESPLLKLEISENEQVGDLGIISLASMLPFLQLTWLDAFNIGASDGGLLVLAESIGGSQLQQLGIWEHGVDQEGTIGSAVWNALSEAVPTSLLLNVDHHQSNHLEYHPQHSLDKLLYQLKVNYNQNQLKGIQSKQSGNQSSNYILIL